MKRREFLKTSALGAGALGLDPAMALAQAQSKISSYRPLGKTGLKMSDISLGTGRLPAASMILRAFAKGINYLDTAPDYGSSEDMIGTAMPRLPRDKVIIATKFCSPEGYPAHLAKGSKKKDYIQALEKSLQRMKTDYADIVFVHALGEMSYDFAEEKSRLLSPELHEAVEDLKKQGKMRFLAASSHGPDHLEDLLSAAIDSGKFDLVMAAFNFMKYPQLPQVIKKAHAQGVGFVAMKTLAGARDQNLDPKGADFAQAAFRWVLSHPEVSGLVVSMPSVSKLDSYLAASGTGFGPKDQELLDRYAALHGQSYCRTGCNDCYPACPAGVEIAKVLRQKMYFSDYGQEKQAMRAYASIKGSAAACATCREQACQGACPHGLPLAHLLRQAHEDLRLV